MAPGTFIVVRKAGRRIVAFLSDVNAEDGEADVSCLITHTDILS